MIPFSVLAEQEGNPQVFKTMFEIMAKNEPVSIGDAPTLRSHSTDDIKEMQDVAWSHILGERALVGDSHSITEMQKSITCDGYFNNKTGVGTPADASYFSEATIPVAISPYEATSLYSSGGLPEIIINKKSKGVLLNGLTFVSKDPFWNDGRILKIDTAVDETGMEEILAENLTWSLIFGGAVMYPVLKKESVFSFELPIEQLGAKGLLDKGCIDYWTGTDRYNTLIIPNYIVTAKDYLTADTIYIPMAGHAINTSRVALLKPKKLPFWGAVMQLGWGTSDLEGYIRSIYGYKMTVAASPMMAQQISLIVRKLPLDGLLAMGGNTAIKDLIEQNKDMLTGWSAAKPTVINDIGGIDVINRTYTGFDSIVLIMRQDIAAQSGIPESVLFHTQPKGFSNNTEEVLLKESQTVRLTQKQVAPSLKAATRFMVYHAFGYDSPEAAHIDTLRLTFDNPVIATESERAETAARMAASVNSLVQAGIPIDNAIVFVAREFFKSITLDEEMKKAVKEIALMQKEVRAQDLVNMKKEPTKEVSNGNKK